jgi:hypothetical protein
MNVGRAKRGGCLRVQGSVQRAETLPAPQCLICKKTEVEGRFAIKAEPSWRILAIPVRWCAKYTQLMLRRPAKSRGWRGWQSGTMRFQGGAICVAAWGRNPSSC